MKHVENYYLISIILLLQLVMQPVFHHIFISRVWERCQGLPSSDRRAIASAEFHQAFAKSFKIFLALPNFFVTSLSSHSAVTAVMVSKENLVFTSELKPSYLLCSVNLQLVPTAGFFPY